MKMFSKQFMKMYFCFPFFLAIYVLSLNINVQFIQFCYQTCTILLNVNDLYNMYLICEKIF